MKGRSLCWWAAAAICLSLTACFSPQHNESIQIAGPRLQAKSIVYVAIPPDARFKNNLALDSGRQTAAMLYDAFGKYVARVYVGRQVETFVEALETTRRHSCTYLIYPTVLRWEDHATERSGVPDKVEVKIETVDVKSGDVLHATILKETGPWIGADDSTPLNLLRKPVMKYVAELFQGASTEAGARK